ncbi:hypothetical protein GIB67_028709 [Kingdonia uniflora]|uniref:Uncharacterized protein n=1 Tax=Kingdonia uniflora TaxID=39325 RepID=A0A7J7NA19_9MAGN|nr:hypothetical protein GIB67_028709 [Kingdonia uniflora]
MQMGHYMILQLLLSVKGTRTFHFTTEEFSKIMIITLWMISKPTSTAIIAELLQLVHHPLSCRISHKAPNTASPV